MSKAADTSRRTNPTAVPLSIEVGSTVFDTTDHDILRQLYLVSKEVPLVVSIISLSQEV